MEPNIKKDEKINQEAEALKTQQEVEDQVAFTIEQDATLFQG